MMKAKIWLQKKIQEFKNDFDYKLESLILDITEKISKRMSEKNINRSKLAGLLDVSPPAVTKILNGNSNFTLKTLLSISNALDLNLNIDFEPREYGLLKKDSFDIIGYQSVTVNAFSGQELTGSAYTCVVPAPELNANEPVLMSEELKEAQIAA